MELHHDKVRIKYPVNWFCSVSVKEVDMPLSSIADVTLTDDEVLTAPYGLKEINLWSTSDHPSSGPTMAVSWVRGPAQAREAILLAVQLARGPAGREPSPAPPQEATPVPGHPQVEVVKELSPRPTSQTSSAPPPVAVAAAAGAAAAAAAAVEQAPAPEPAPSREAAPKAVEEEGAGAVGVEEVEAVVDGVANGAAKEAAAVAAAGKSAVAEVAAKPSGDGRQA
ncbi:hypothetical protein HYH03_012629 [Edaphochlamys debaryana]|uniref:Uncharacterized protein n=1 Tax=Edaphochlamys debaryana TaxID=47281 RepID=A0A836BTY2_9CHLO|nr:hypothetical protein HYH03_012629 [Edaphochlamys debaryana]|eukprot:KAG2488830.1 hypothetical protein HYH03_012629 [Edaphochlamys debaryana]